MKSDQEIQGERAAALSRSPAKTGGPTLDEVRMLIHACAADHPRSPGFRNYLALRANDPDASSMENRGLIEHTGERDGFVYWRVTEPWRLALLGQRKGRHYVDAEDLDPPCEDPFEDEATANLFPEATS